MDATILAAVIGAASTVTAAVLGRTGLVDAVFTRRHGKRLSREWDSTWIDIKDKKRIEYKERLFITKQRGERVSGYILVDSVPDKKWEFEGKFTGRFLQLIYEPSGSSKLFVDYGCYLFELRGSDFVGYSVGYDYQGKEIGLSEHKLTPRA